MICPACDNPFWYLLERTARHELSHECGEPESVRFENCRRCGLTRRIPFPSASALKRYYESAWQTQTGRPKACLDSAADWIVSGLKPYQIEKFTSGLDVGAKTPEFLDVIAKWGCPIEEKSWWDPQPSVPSSRAWLGYPEDDGERPVYLEKGYLLGSMLVTCTHVLEHVLNPSAFLEDLGRFVRSSGGYLYLEVPALEGTDYAVDNINRNHLWHFSLDSLVRLVSRGFLRERGFQLLKAETRLEPQGWPTNRVLLRTNDANRQDHAPTQFFYLQEARQLTAYRKALKTILEHDPERACLYGACDTLLQIADAVAPDDEKYIGAGVEKLRQFRIFDLYKWGQSFLWEVAVHLPAEGALPPFALITTRNWQSVQDIKQYIRENHPNTTPVSLFFD